MSFRNPFNRLGNIDQSNYLRVNLLNFLELDGKPQQFRDAITELQQIREGLQVANQIGRLAELPGRDFYLEAVKWLGLNSPIQSGVPVSQISSYDDINDAIAISFLQFVEWLRNGHFVNNPLYQQIQIALGVGKAGKFQRLDQETRRLEGEFQKALLTSQEELSSSIERQKNDLSSNLSQQFTTQVSQISEAGENAIGLIKQAQSFETWREYYQDNVELYEIMLSGRKWRSISTKGRLKNFAAELNGRIANYIANKRSDKWGNARYISKGLASLLMYVISRSIRCLAAVVTELIKYGLSKLSSIKGRRLLWFTFLSVVLVIQAIVVFLVATDPHIHGEFALRIQKLLQKEFVGAKISAFVGFVLVPSLGYASSNKNYRIYSNILEQYRHRATVAQTLQGVLRNIAEGDDNKDIREKLAAVAAVAMFELKTVGHLTKGGDTGLPLAEVFQGLFGSR